MSFKLLLLFNVLHLLAANEADKLKVSIYYETYCPCSINFITKQFFPTYVKLNDYLEIDLIPSGNMTYELIDGSWVFECQRGKQECHANKIHACTLMQDTEEFEKIDFIYCIADGKYGDFELQTCARLARMSWKKIKDCVDDPETDDLLVEFGELSKKANLTHIPAVIFNDEYEKTLDENARKEFLLTTCNLLQDQEPVACSEGKLEVIV